MAALTPARLRAAVVRHAFGAPRAPLGEVVARLGFVQADPIRVPARAQDLILRQRVADYRAGQLERRYPALALDEEFVYAYGFVPPATRALLHPRGAVAPQGLDAEVLALVRERGPAHPDAVAAALGTHRETNWWGGQSRVTTRALERLHGAGWLRVARRDRGVRVYAHAEPPTSDRSPDERWQARVLHLATLFGPIPERGLRGVLRLARRGLPGVRAPAAAIPALVRAGALERETVDGTPWLWPPEARPVPSGGAPRRVRLLAPFDPVVWDRDRVARLWGWEYRFEAYVPAPRRRFGYYALPMLWGDRLIGWANVTVRDGALDVRPGFVAGRPTDRAFDAALDAELARLARFLAL